MSALSADRLLSPGHSFVADISLPVAAAAKFYRGAMVCFDISDVSAAPAGTGTDTDTFPVGFAINAPDNTNGQKGDLKVLTEVHPTVECHVLHNDDAGGALDATDLLSIVYWLDDQTVTSTSTNNSKAGRLWRIDGDGMCHVELLRPAP
jgi:hypothetical protein